MSESAIPTLGTSPAPTLPLDMWAEPDASSFRLRSASYLHDHVKTPSAPSMFTLLAVDLFEVPDTTPNIASHPRNRYNNTSCLLVFVFVRRDVDVTNCPSMLWCSMLSRVFQAKQRGDDTWVFVVNIMVSTELAMRLIWLEW